MVSKRKEVYWSVDSSPSDSLGLLTDDVRNTKPPSTVTKKKTSRRSTLKTLCPEDKHKVRQLIEDLAKTGAEKDAIEQVLKRERNDFDEKLSQLQLEQDNLKEERMMERSLHDSELKLQAIKSENDKLVQARSIPVLQSASADQHLQLSRDHSAPSTAVVNLDHSLNYLLHSINSNVQPPQYPSSSTSSSSLVSSLHTTDLTMSQQLDDQPPSAVDNCVPQPNLSVQPHSSAAYCDTGVQTIMVTHTGVQTDQYGVVPAVSSHQSVTAMSSSEFDHKMEHMMATALLNAKDTVNTIEALSQSLLLKNVSRESSLITVPLFTSAQGVANSQNVTENDGVANSQNVTNNKGVANTPRMTTIQELANTSLEYTNQMDARTHVAPSGHTHGSSHADHMISPPQHSYTLYDTTGCHHEDTSLYLNRNDELQLEDLAETLNTTTPMGWLNNRTSTACGRKHSNIAMATPPVGEHFIINHSDSDVINDLFFLQ